LDAAGAEKLRWRIEQQQHWRQAQAVLDGRQPSVDPDQNDLEMFESDLRIYASRSTRDGVVRLCKRLVDGAWQHGTIDAELNHAISTARGPAGARGRASDGERAEHDAGDARARVR
jgi:hypothetical protein